MFAFQILLLIGLGMASSPAETVPPPSSQLTANCSDPTYASDQLVCADAELLELDRLLKERVGRGGPTDLAGPDGDTNEDWFRRSRLCAFDSDHRACLMAAYCLRLAVLATPDDHRRESICEPVGDYLPVDTFSRAGFARAGVDLEPLLSKEIRVHGFVDHLNIYGDEAAKAILRDWWAGSGPDEQTWRFGLKARESDPAGHSIYVELPNDLLRDDLLRLFAADANAGRPTQVSLRGRLVAFDAPLNLTRRSGLGMIVASTQQIRPSTKDP